MLIDASAEMAVLGYFMVRGLEGFQNWPARAVYFTAGPRRAVFEAMERLATRGDPIEFPTIHAELERPETHGEVSTEFLLALAETAATTPGALLALLADLALRRALDQTADHLRAAAVDRETEPHAALQRTLDVLARQTAAIARIEDAPELPVLEQQWLAALERGDGAAQVPLQTGLVDLDRSILGDLPRGEVVIVGARTATGKTAFLLQQALHNASAGAHVLFCSAEMTWSQLVARAKTAQTGIPLQRLLRRGPLSMADLAALRAEPLQPVRVCDKAAMTTADVRALAARYAITPRPFDIVYVDHLHHLADRAAAHETRYGQLGRMVASLKDTAKAHGCVLVVAAQLNRDAADRAPTLADIRDAGTIEEYASIVLLLHRTDKAKTECEVRIAKHRNGPTGLVKLYFDPERLRFRDFERRSR
jgi:replicative DNA helicase